MKLLHRYVLKEIIGPMGLGLLVFTFIFLIGILFKLTDQLLSSGIKPSLAGELILLILPGIMSITVPMALLVGVLLGMGRLAADREILAIKASGVSMARIAMPIIAFSILISGIMIWGNMRLIPYINLKLADLQTQVIFQGLSAIPAGVPFPMPTEGQGNDSTIMIESKDGAGKLSGVTMLATWKAGQDDMANRNEVGDLLTSSGKATKSIEDAMARKSEKETSDSETVAKKSETKKPKNKKDAKLKERRDKERRDYEELINEKLHEVVILAEGGEFDPVIEQRVVYVHLTTGSIHLSDPDNPTSYDLIKFDKLTRGIVPSFDRTEKGFFEKNPKEMSVKELRQQISVRDKGKKYSVELYQRFSVPLACIAFALIAFPLAVYVRPTGKAVAFGISFLLILFYYGLQQYGVALTQDNRSFGPAVIFFPNLIISGIGIFMLYRIVTR